MKSPIVPINEIQRLAALKRTKLLDSSPEEVFDNFTKLASIICETPIALITLVDDTRQWFKSNIGLNVSETPRDVSFCGHAILDNKLFEIPDALNDARFCENPLVVSAPQIRFYAGMPLITNEGHAFGTLCVIDTMPKQLTYEQRSMLQMLGRQVVTLIEYRMSLIEMGLVNYNLAEHLATFPLTK